ncbi:hypothetical protein L1987_70272 [Smallanthus sonchifolius]|uniref:Uncharacterized protein n=1 Tax=Smallanthus sonchifolius TaxID=185202 RepID=A0ACB9AQ08_9ASTR|nr:hypothetical protein L1987_70272 [Smallanthus sonchifolius]
MSNLSKSPIDYSKPLWVLHLLDIKTSDAEGTGVFRFHHSLGDGLSLMTLFLACTRQSADIDALPTLHVSKETTYIKVTSFCSVLKVLWNSVVAMMLFVFTVLFLKDDETPLKGSLGVENKPRRFVRKSVNIADIKAVKNAMNVVKSVISERKMIMTLVDSMKAGTLGRWGNQIGYVLLPFAMGLKSNPLDYVKEAKAVIDQKKASLEPLFSYFVVEMVLKLFGIKAVGKLNHKVFFNTTLALMVHIVSYIDKLTFVISADEETIPDPHRLCDDLEESLHLIKASALAKGITKNKLMKGNLSAIAPSSKPQNPRLTISKEAP